MKKLFLFTATVSATEKCINLELTEMDDTAAGIILIIRHGDLAMVFHGGTFIINHTIDNDGVLTFHGMTLHDNIELAGAATVKRWNETKHVLLQALGYIPTENDPYKDLLHNFELN